MMSTPCVCSVVAMKKRRQSKYVHGIITMGITRLNIISGSPDPRLKTTVFNVIFSEELFPRNGSETTPYQASLGKSCFHVDLMHTF